MPLPEEKSQEEKNKIIMGSFINEIFNNHDLSSLEKISVMVQSSPVFKYRSFHNSYLISLMRFLIGAQK